MSRTISAAIQAVLGLQGVSVVHLLSFAVGDTNYFFAEDLVTFQGNTYLPYLKLDSPIKYDQTTTSKPVKSRGDFGSGKA